MRSLAWEPRAVQLSVFNFPVAQRKKKLNKTRRKRERIQESSDKRKGLQRRGRDFATFWEVNREKKKRREKKVVTQAAAL